MKKQQLGFTLIELAIVLVIIGLLLGGVLKGQELINSAKVKSMATDFKNIQVYLYGYQDKFKALPGDDRAASTHLAGAANATTGGSPGDAVIQGLYGSNTATEESVLFWQHVRLAGLAAGPTDVAAENYFPVNADGGRIRHTKRGHLGSRDAHLHCGTSRIVWGLCYLLGRRIG